MSQLIGVGHSFTIVINPKTALIKKKVHLLLKDIVPLIRKRRIPIGLLSDRLLEEQSTLVEEAKNVKQNEADQGQFLSYHFAEQACFIIWNWVFSLIKRWSDLWN